MGINPAILANGKLISVLAVMSPINGVVSDVKVKMGSYVDVTTPVAEIVDNSQLHLDLSGGSSKFKEQPVDTFHSYQ